MAITDADGAILEKRQFDAWGALIKVQDGAGNNLNGLILLDRGYTGHEHLPSLGEGLGVGFGLINMNGRLYDPKLHRFLQPDNYVQDPSNTQNYNRYGYCINNPLKYTDPSGEISFKSFGRWVSRNANDIIAGVQIVVGVVLLFTPLAVVGVGLIGAGVGHFAATYNEYKQTGDWEAASKNQGVSFNFSFETDFGYNNDNKPTGVIQNEPVIPPMTKDDVRNMSSGYVAQSGGIDWGYTGNILGAGGTTFAGLENAVANKYWWMDAKGNYNSTKILKIGENGKYVKGVQGLRYGYSSALKAANGYKVAGSALGVLSLGVTYMQYREGQIYGTEASIDAAFGVIGFFGPIGAGVSATYFIGKFGYEYFSGNTIFEKP